jgi:hypothetical protein
VESKSTEPRLLPLPESRIRHHFLGGTHGDPVPRAD